MEKHQFKPFDQVLVRDSNKGKWLMSHYGYETTGVERQVHVCSNGTSFYQCIPYNEETAHLLGTTNSYRKTKKWHVSSHFGNFEEEFDDEELENFIKTAVMNNKDITNFHVRYIDK